MYSDLPYLDKPKISSKFQMILTISVGIVDDQHHPIVLKSIPDDFVKSVSGTTIDFYLNDQLLKTCNFQNWAITETFDIDDNSTDQNLNLSMVINNINFLSYFNGQLIKPLICIDNIFIDQISIIDLFGMIPNDLVTNNLYEFPTKIIGENMIQTIKLKTPIYRWLFNNFPLICRNGYHTMRVL
jgi:hypothetical protein